MKKIERIKKLIPLLPAVVLILSATGVTVPWKETYDPGLQAAENPLVAQGHRLYSQLRCEYCHRLKGRGGSVGPALDGVGFRRDTDWMAGHFRNPQKLSQGSKMARIALTDPQVKALTAYMNSLGGRTYTPQAPILFARYCVSCHGAQEKGSGRLQDLSNEGKYRDLDFIRDYIHRPLKMNFAATMPGFAGKLTEAQIKDLSIYIFQNGR